MSGTLGLIGFGNMGKAIGRGLVKQGVLSASDLVVYDIDEKAMEAARELGAATADSECSLCANSEVILLAVKPDAAKGALSASGSGLAGKALISIVAGLDQKTMGEWTGNEARILRVMPNTPALIGEGAFGFSSGSSFTKEEKVTTENWFSAIGHVEWVAEERMDAVTGLSGGGPAYVALFVEALADGGVQQGLKRDVAYRLAAQTVLGTAKMILDTGSHPGALKDAVCSPGGTTIEGILALERGGVRAAVSEAVVKSSEKSRQLNKKETTGKGA